MINETINDSNSSLLNVEHYYVSELQRNITISILIIFSFPSLICFLFTFYYFIKLHKCLLMNCINHHVILLILIIDFLLITTELPITLYYLSFGNVYTRKICIFWIYWDYTLEQTSLILIMYASIERYLLIFFKFYITKHNILLHYIPMLCICFYIPILYLYFIVLSPCTQTNFYDITSFVCGGGCFFQYVPVNTYDSIVDTMLPCFIILILNIIIILRVTFIKNRALKSISLIKILRRNRRMILQLIGISLTSLIAWMPWVIIIIVQNFFQPSFGNWFINYILHYLPYLTTSLSPFLALIGLPEIRKHFKMIKYQTKSIRKETNSPPKQTNVEKNNVFESTYL